MSEDFAKTFYSRQTILKELGNAGQKKLSEARVAVVGVGGLGSVSSLYLALAGVGYVRVIDQDTVEAHNLHRQLLYTKNELNLPKAEAAAQTLRQHNPMVEVEAVCENLNAGNADKLLRDVDVVVDGLDNMPTRHIVNRACIKHGVPYVFGAAIGLEGNVSVFYPPKTGCLECLMPSGAAASSQTCDSRGIIGATAGVIGSIQALETVKLIADVGEPLLGKLLVCDFSDMDFTVLPISENPVCPACHAKTAKVEAAERLVWLCGKDTANINPQTPLKATLDELYPAVQKHFGVRLKSQMAIMFTACGVEVSLFAGGRMLLKGAKTEEQALDVYREVTRKICP